MHGYRVIFKNNIPQSASRLDIVDNRSIVHLTTEGGHKCMDWLVVPGNNENDAISIANRLMQTIWANYLKNCK